MRTAVLTSLLLLSGCVNPMYQGQGGQTPVAQSPSAATMRQGWGGDTSGWAGAPQNTSGSANQAPGGNTGPVIGWGQTAPGDRSIGSARTVPPGSSGAGLVPVVDLQRGMDGPVESQPLGTVAGIEGAPRSTAESSSRASLFEQFQRLEEDRDALRQQVAAMQVEFERMAGQAAQQSQLENTSAQEANALRARIEQLEGQNRQLSTENEDLAGRLLTAQIRRLESEKALLEHMIATEQSRGQLQPSPRSTPPTTPPAAVGAGAANTGGPS